MSIHTHEAVPQKTGKPEWVQTLWRASLYLATRGLVVCVTVAIGVYAAIWVTNLGGAGDRIRKDQIAYQVKFRMGSLGRGAHTISNSDPAFLEMLEAAYAAADLDKPFFLRSFRYFRAAFSFTLLDVLRSGAVWRTLMIFGIGSLITFFGGLYIALALSLRHGGFLDRMATLLVPIFAAPSWFHGLALVTIFAALIKLLPWGGWISPPIPETSFTYLLAVLRHMILPLTASVLGSLPLAVYANRALFLVNSSEDYVEMGRAMGLRPGKLMRRYVLRPVLPAIITNFTFISLMAWEGVILTEKYFNWPGIAHALLAAIEAGAVESIGSYIAILACLIGVSVFFLDVLYVLVDPRVKLGEGASL